MYMPQTPPEGPHTSSTHWVLPPPSFNEDESLGSVISELSLYFVETIEAPHTFEQLRTASVGHILTPLVKSLSSKCRHPRIVTALLILKWHFDSLEQDNRAINESRGFACEIVAWRFLAHLSEHDLIEHLLHELPTSHHTSEISFDVEASDSNGGTAGSSHVLHQPEEHTPLLRDTRLSSNKGSKLRPPNFLMESQSLMDGEGTGPVENDLSLAFVGLNALEVAAVANAKKFLSQQVVQKVVNSIWSGNIVFWDSLNVNTKKKAQLYNKRKADLYCRLRVPKYQKVFEALFFLMFLVLYYAVLIERNPRTITMVEILLYIWIAAFAYDELGEFQDAGTLFYAADFWSLWDIGIVGIGVAFLVARVIGLLKDSDRIIDVSFDILSLEALFLFPRICSLLSLHQYFGTLIPCLKEMTKDFLRFLGIVTILFVGFLTTFTMLARDSFTASQIWWMMINVFFGASALGLDIASEISPALGPTLMVCFVITTNILLLSALIAILSQSLTKVMDHAREEYLFQYSVFVLEASASRRLTYYLPPLNLIPLILFRPLRIFVSASKLRSGRIALLKITHLPYVAAIWAYEGATLYISNSGDRQQNASPPPRHPFIGTHVETAHRRPQSLAKGSRSDASLLGQKPAKSESASGATPSESMIELQKSITQLRIQVEELSRRIATSQEDPRSD